MPTDTLNLAHVRVLVVEDEPLIALDAEDLLRAMGVQDVIHARNVAEGIRALDGREVNAALLDMRLGHESSLPLAQRLASANVPFGFMTGMRDDALPNEFKSRPIVFKPYTRRQLIDLMRGLAGQR